MVARSFTVGGVVQAGSVKAWLWCVDSRLAGVQTNGSIQLGIVLPKAGGVCVCAERSLFETETAVALFTCGIT